MAQQMKTDTLVQRVPILVPPARRALLVLLVLAALANPTDSFSPNVHNIAANAARGRSSHDWPSLVRTPSPNTQRYHSTSPNKSSDMLLRWQDILEPHHNLDGCRIPDETTRKQALRSVSAILTATCFVIASLITISGPGAWRYYYAGGICAAASHVIPVPIDVVKTRKQVDTTLANQSFGQAFMYILKHEGVHGLLSGLGPTAVGYALEGAMKFGVYEVLKPNLSNALLSLSGMSTYLRFLSSKILVFIVSAAVAGVAASLVLEPMEALRIRMVANPSKKGWLSTGYDMLQTEGVSSYFKGLVPMLCKQVPYTVTKNVSFDYITKYAYKTLVGRGSVIGPSTKLVVPFCSAAVTSILSSLASQPGDVLLSLMHARNCDQRRTVDIIDEVWHSERGIRGFFAGTKTRIFHVGVTVTVQLLIYDLVKRICGIAATGFDS